MQRQEKKPRQRTEPINFVVEGSPMGGAPQCGTSQTLAHSRASIGLWAVEVVVAATAGAALAGTRYSIDIARHDEP